MSTRLYGGISSAAIVLPDGHAFEEIHQSYIDMAVAARVTEAQRRTFFAAGHRLCEAQGAEAVILGGTDLGLAFQGQDPGFPVIGCVEIHVEALYRWSVRME